MNATFYGTLRGATVRVSAQPDDDGEVMITLATEAFGIYDATRNWRYSEGSTVTAFLTQDDAADLALAIVHAFGEVRSRVERGLRYAGYDEQAGAEPEADVFSESGPECECGHAADVHDDGAPHQCFDEIDTAPYGPMGASSPCPCTAYRRAADATV